MRVLLCSPSVLLGLSISAVVSACGSVENDSRDAATGDGGRADAGADAGGSVDAGTDAGADAGGPCRLDEPFREPMLLSGGINTGAEETHPTLTPDELAIFFARLDVKSDHEIYVATRSARGEAFGPPVPVPELNSPTSDLAPSLTFDGATMVFGTVRSITSFDLWSSSRDSTDSPWDPPEVIAGVDDDGTFLDSAPCLRSDGAELLFMSDRGPEKYGHLYRAVIAGGVASNVTEITELNTTTAETEPVLSADGTTLYFASWRPDGGARGGLDIWTASRSDLEAPFADLANVTELNTSDDDSPGWLSPDGCRIYFDSGRSGVRDILVAERPE